MYPKTLKTIMLGLALQLGALGSAHAGPYSDDLSKCLVSGTTLQEKGVLVRWVFANTALHPEVSSMFQISAEKRDALNKEVAKLFDRLVVETCRTETQMVLKYEGSSAFQESFGILGRAAMSELTSSPQVNYGFREFTKYLDKEKLQNALKPAP